MQEDIKIYKAEDGAPWDFVTEYKILGNQISFYNLNRVGKDDGPLSGDLKINGQEIPHEGYRGFGGPIIIKDHYLYLTAQSITMWEYSFLIELNMLDNSYRVMGDCEAVMYLDNLKENVITYYSSYEKEDETLMQIDIITGNTITPKKKIDDTNYNKKQLLCSKIEYLLSLILEGIIIVIIYPFMFIYVKIKNK